MGGASGKINKLLYALHYARIRYAPERLIRDYSKVHINSPIFLLGISGGGLTLISRMLRRNAQVVSISGDNSYWSGPDEMAVVLGSELPFELGGIVHKLPENDLVESTANWRYACDELLDMYRKLPEDVSCETSERLRHIIGWATKVHGRNDQARFTDKSQVYTVRAGYINQLLSDSNPMFILITRNPYAVCYRAPTHTALSRLKELSFRSRLKIACQHWSNSMQCALKDAQNIPSFMCLRFEDVLIRTESTISKICEFVDIDYADEMIPSAEQKIPYGSRCRDRWYPLRKNVNEKHLEKVGGESLEIIESICGDIAEKFGYTKPKS